MVATQELSSCLISKVLKVKALVASMALGGRQQPFEGLEMSLLAVR